jgi:hypothetical protein
MTECAAYFITPPEARRVRNRQESSTIRIKVNGTAWVHDWRNYPRVFANLRPLFAPRTGLEGLISVCEIGVGENLKDPRQHLVRRLLR